MCNPNNFADVLDGRTQKMPEKCRRTIRTTRARFLSSVGSDAE